MKKEWTAPEISILNVDETSYGNHGGAIDYLNYADPTGEDFEQS